ncbi:Anoctamin-1 [Folsomia candida]|uniref:Anoctamin n=1 Tax=Folsomia candida TaxID=158441 RepID=A0A226EUY4_FOLCA|nr:Anoctamin-1 [Folsomia candida]
MAVVTVSEDAVEKENGKKEDEEEDDATEYLNLEPEPLEPGSAMDPDRIDFVLVWNGQIETANSAKSIEKRKVFETHLEKEGLVLSREVLRSKKLHFLKIHAPLEVLQRYAEILRLQMPIKEIPGTLDLHQKRRTLLDMLPIKALCTLSYFQVNTVLFPKFEQRVTAPYNKEKHYLFDVDETNEIAYFNPAIRSRIVHFILKRKRYKEDDTDTLAFGYERLIESDVYCAGYPLHDGDYNAVNCQRGLLYYYWASFRNCLKFQPLDSVRSYFGVKIAVYYAWLGFYTQMLIVPAILGVISFVYGAASISTDRYTQEICDAHSETIMCPLCDVTCTYWNLSSICFHSKFTQTFDNDSTAIFAFFMSIWTVVFLEFWKRYSAELNYRWDLNNFDSDQLPRPEFAARLKDSKAKRFNYITNSIEPAVPFWQIKLPFTFISLTGVMILIFVALAASVGVVVYRISTLVAVSSWPNALMLVNFTAAFINLIFILGFSWIYRPIAKWLTDLEIPRTFQEYEASFAFKLYALQFINHYASLFYIAYFKGNFVGSPNKYTKLFGRWRQEELSVILVGKQTLNSIMEMIIPYFQKLYNNQQLKRVSKENVEVIQHQIVKDYKLLAWDSDHLTEEYLEMVIQYGFVTIFVAAFPLAPFFALINNIFELRFDAQKLLKHHRRPISIRVKGIGVWYQIIDTVAKFAVLSNAFIIAITSNFVPKIVYRFFILERNDTRYGTLVGFLNHTLSKYAIEDLEKTPDPTRSDGLSPPPSSCNFPAYRNDYSSPGKYEYTDEHWKVWLGRVIFVIAFENIVATCFMFIRWAIPDVPEEIKIEIQREQYLTNELIIKQELLRARGVISEAQCFHKVHPEDLEKVVNKTDFEMYGQYINTFDISTTTSSSNSFLSFLKGTGKH